MKTLTQIVTKEKLNTAKSVLGYSNDASTLFLAEVDVVTAGVAIFPGEKYSGSFERDGILLILSDNEFMPSSDAKQILVPYDNICLISTQDTNSGIRVTRSPTSYSHLIIELTDGRAIKLSLLRHITSSNDWVNENLLLIQHIVDTRQLPLAGSAQHQVVAQQMSQQQVQPVCPNCQARVEPNQAFCTNCGIKLG